MSVMFVLEKLLYGHTSCASSWSRLLWSTAYLVLLPSLSLGFKALTLPAFWPLALSSVVPCSESSLLP